MSDDQQPTPPPLDLEKMASIERMLRGGGSWLDDSIGPHVSYREVFTELLRLRAEVADWTRLAEAREAVLENLSAGADAAVQERDQARADLAAARAALAWIGNRTRALEEHWDDVEEMVAMLAELGDYARAALPEQEG